MADVNANIGINIDSSNALGQLKALQRQISQFHTSIARSSEAAALAQKGLQKNLLNSINAIGSFTAEMRTVRTSAESFTNSLEKNKFSMREYFRYAGASTKTFGKLFKSEFDTIGKVAEERVKRLQTQYIKMGRDTNGAMKAMAVMPTRLDMSDYTTKIQIAAQKQALFNQLMKQGSTNLLNFGKNTQWAGRQLMVGFTLPLMLLGSTATKTFMDMEAQALRFRKVYGDLFTPQGETQAALDNIIELGKQFTKYGVAVSTTVGLASEAAAAGFQGLDLQRQTAQATRLSILGQVESQKALETTISLQNAFGMSSEKLAESIDFLNAVENQTVVSLDDITTAIPKVAPVIQQLGGDVKDLTFFMAAMKEGGINASEGANALKSGLAALINPTKKASDMLAGFGINANAIVEKNKGDLKATVIGFAQALNQLDPLSRARAIEQMFGKFQFARLSTLFANVAKDGNQASRVLDLANSSVEELASLSEKELGMTAESSMNKFKKSVEDLKVALVPVGEAFLQALTPIIEFVGGILEKFSNLSDGTKKLITLLTVGIGAVGPVLLMTFGLLANGIANIIKLFLTLRGGYQRLTGQSQILGEQTQYMTMEQLDAAAAAHSLNQTHANLTQTFTAEVAQINKLISAYNSAAGAARNFSINNPGMMMPGRAVRKLANGIVSVPGSGNKDTVPAMLTPGESVIPAKMTKKYAPLINGMIADNIPGYQFGRGPKIPIYAENAIRLQNAGQNMRQQSGAGTGLYNVLANLAARVGESRGIPVTQKRIAGGQFDDITEEYKEVTQKFVDKLNTNYDHVITKVSDTNKAYAIAWKQAGRAVQSEVNNIKNDVEKGVVRRVFGLEKDIYSTIPTAPRSEGGNIPERARQSAFKMDKFGISSYTKLRPGIKALYERQSGQSAADLQMGHVFGSKQVDINQLMRDPQAASGVKTAARVMGIQIANNAAEGIGQGAREILAATSPSREMKKIGQDGGQGLILGAQEYVDDAKRVGQQLAGGMVQTASGLFVPGGSGVVSGAVAGNAPRVGVPLSTLNAAYEENAMRDLMKKQQERIAITNRRMNSLNKAFMSGTFALSALSGVASMAGGNLGKFSQILFTITGPLFALSSILQMLTGTKIMQTLANLGKLKLGLITVGLAAFGVAIKVVNDAREKERMALEGLSNALTTTKDKAKFLGDFFGTVASPRAGSQAVFSAAETKPTERTKIQELKASEEFQSKYKKDIEAFATATNEQVLLGFQTMALDLRGQGFAKETIDIIIKSIAEEAKQTDVLLKFKTIDFDLSKETGANYVSALAKQVADDFSTVLPDAIGEKGIVKIIGKTAVNLGKEADLTTAQKAKINESGIQLSNILTGIQGQFKAGIINAKQYNLIINKTIDGVSSNANAHLLFQSALEKTNPEIAKVTKGMTDANEIALVYQATLVGFTPKLQALFASLSGARPFERPGLIKGIREELLAGEKLLQEIYGTGTGTSTGKGELNALQERIKGIKNQTEAFILLRNAKIDEKTATELSNDAEIASLILKNKSSKLLPKIIANIKEYSKALKAQAQAEKDFADPTTTFKNEIERLQAVAKLREKLIDIDFAPKIKKETDELTAQEQKLADINEKIQEITRKEIDPKKRTIDENNFALEKIAAQEDVINEKYNKQIEALDKIEKANQNIANIQKQRMSIADALTRGDISAAAMAMQDARAERAQSALTGQREGLTANRDMAITALGRVALEKENKKLQLEISTIEATQLKTLELQKQVIEDKIVSTNKNIKTLNEEVSVLKEGSYYAGKTKEDIDNLAELISAAEAAGIPFTAELLKQATNAERLAAALLKSSGYMSGLSSSAVSGAGAPITETTKYDEIFKKSYEESIAMGNTVSGARAMAGMSSRLQAQADAYFKANPNIDPFTGAQRKMFGGPILSKGKGGMGIVKAMAFGGRAIGSDTVPAMLTPGEFIVNKSASRAYAPLLERINESKYPGMLSGGGQPQVPVNNISTSTNDNSTAVYNYNLGFSINGANGSAKDIANAVMREIKNVDSQRIRGQRQ